MSSGMAESPSENWMKPGDFTPFHLASFKTLFWYIRPPASAPKTSEDLNGKSVAILKSAGYEPMRQWEKILNIDVIRARTTQNTIKMLMSGRVDFVFFSEASMRWHFRQMGLNFSSVDRVQAPEMLVQTEVYLLFGGAISEELRGKFLHKLRNLEASGELEDIRRSYHFDAPGSA